MTQKKIIVGISGSSGIQYGIMLLDMLNQLNIETHLVISQAAKLTLKYETRLSYKDICQKASFYYSNQDFSAPIASGSFQTDGMIIAPCSMKSLSEISHGLSQTLISRSADVMLKERRRLIIIPRETPLNLIHIENMQKATLMGAVIFMPVPAFYNQPSSLEDAIADNLGRVLDLLDIKNAYAKRWESTQQTLR